VSGSDRERDLEAVRRLVDRVARANGVGTRVEIHEGTVDRPAAADMVVSFDLSAGPGWERRLGALAALARKVLVVVVPNPERVGASRAAGERWETLAIAPVLWELGRVREHEYLAIPRAVAAIARLRGGTASSADLRGATGAIVRRAARLHAFVVDTTPRTPQARRRLRTAEEGGSKKAPDV